MAFPAVFPTEVAAFVAPLRSDACKAKTPGDDAALAMAGATKMVDRVDPIPPHPRAADAE